MKNFLIAGILAFSACSKISSLSKDGAHKEGQGSENGGQPDSGSKSNAEIKNLTALAHSFCANINDNVACFGTGNVVGGRPVKSLGQKLGAPKMLWSNSESIFGTFDSGFYRVIEGVEQVIKTDDKVVSFGVYDNKSCVAYEDHFDCSGTTSAICEVEATDSGDLRERYCTKNIIEGSEGVVDKPYLISLSHYGNCAVNFDHSISCWGARHDWLTSSDLIKLKRAGMDVQVTKSYISNQDKVLQLSMVENSSYSNFRKDICALTTKGVKCWDVATGNALTVPPLNGPKYIGKISNPKTDRTAEVLRCATTNDGLVCWAEDGHVVDDLPWNKSIKSPTYFAQKQQWLDIAFVDDNRLLYAQFGDGFSYQGVSDMTYIFDAPKQAISPGESLIGTWGRSTGSFGFDFVKIKDDGKVEFNYGCCTAGNNTTPLEKYSMTVYEQDLAGAQKKFRMEVNELLFYQRVASLKPKDILSCIYLEELDSENRLQMECSLGLEYPTKFIRSWQKM